MAHVQPQPPLQQQLRTRTTTTPTNRLTHRTLTNTVA
jgi:hypothetical protein